MTYIVRAVRQGRYWALLIDGLGATQARNLGEADHMVRDYVHCMRGVPAESVEYELVLPEEEQQRGEIERLTERTARISAGLLRRLRDR